MSDKKPILKRTDGSGTDYQNDRVELLWAMIVYSLKNYIIPNRWIKEIEDYKGDITITWYYNPPDRFKREITVIWRGYFAENNVNHIILNNE
jgi:hypothetical protein